MMGRAVGIGERQIIESHIIFAVLESAKAVLGFTKTGSIR